MYSVEWEGHTIGWEIHVDKKFAYLTYFANLYIDSKLVAKSPGGFRIIEKVCSELEHKGKTVPVKLIFEPTFIGGYSNLKVDGKRVTKRMLIPFWKVKFGILSVLLNMMLGFAIGIVIGLIIFAIIFLLPSIF